MPSLRVRVAKLVDQMAARTRRKLIEDLRALADTLSPAERAEFDRAAMASGQELAQWVTKFIQDRKERVEG